eukprot:109614-Chlamydomonas_euryale.AAC.2
MSLRLFPLLMVPQPLASAVSSNASANGAAADDDARGGDDPLLATAAAATYAAATIDQSSPNAGEVRRAGCREGGRDRQNAASGRLRSCTRSRNARCVYA